MIATPPKASVTLFFANAIEVLVSTQENPSVADGGARAIFLADFVGRENLQFFASVEDVAFACAGEINAIIRCDDGTGPGGNPWQSFGEKELARLQFNALDDPRIVRAPN